MNLRVFIAVVLFSSGVWNLFQAQEIGNVTVAKQSEGADLISVGNQLLGRGNFSSAINVWKEVSELQPENANAHFKLGLCYRNALDHNPEALASFKKATRSMTDAYRFYSPDEQSAPYDVLFFLGEAYLNNDQPDSALENFIVYQSHFQDETPINTDRHILYCINAKRMKKSLRDVTFEAAGDEVNSAFAETHPVATLDDNLLFFASRRLRADKSNEDQADKVYGQYNQDIYVASRKGNAWADVSLFPLSDKANEVPLAISKDGLKLFFRSDKEGDQNIYVTEFEGGVWRKPKEFDAKINSKANESSFSISEDGSEAYFVSDRDDGLGAADIYVVKKKSNGKWERPENLGSKINTEHNEMSVFIHPTGNTLFWSSNGYLGQGMGGYDIYYAEKQADGTWGNPKNMGYPINTTENDLYYFIGGGGKRYYSKSSPDKSLEIYAVTGGGFEFENLEIGTEVVTLTQEMEVAEILEVEKEVQTEVEVLDLSILDEFETDEESVEEIDLSELGDESTEEETTEAEAEPEFDPLNVAHIDMERLHDDDKDSLIALVQNWLSSTMEAEAVSFTHSGTLYFSKSSRSITRESRAVLDKVAQKLKDDTSKKAVIVGHTDESGDWTVNFKISNERAWEAYRYLRNQGVARSQLIWYGKGSTDPASSNATEQGRERNRRVEIELID